MPPEHVFLLNDRRADAADSRAWGTIPILQLEARAWRIWMSVDWVRNRVNWRRLLARSDKCAYGRRKRLYRVRDDFIAFFVVASSTYRALVRLRRHASIAMK